MDPSSYSIAIGIFLRLLGVIYLFAYIPFLFQILGLMGKEGILPVTDFLQRVKTHYGNKGFLYVPTLFWFNSSDKALLGLIWAGIFFGTLLVLGFQSPWILLILYLLHLSLTTAGQDFLGFGWETYLMEVTVASFFMTLTTPYNTFGWLALNFLLFRFYIQAGMSKIQSQDKNWRNLTAIAYHYLTEPIPNTQAYYFYRFPMWFQKLSVLIMYWAELIAPIFMWGPPLSRLFAFTQIFGLQVSIWFTGNLSYLNHMVAFQSVILIHDKYLSFLGAPQMQAPTSEVWNWIVSIPALAFFLMQVLNLWQTFFPNFWIHRMLAGVNAYHLCYPHGIFAVMTTKRYEIIVEGSDDGVAWKEYQFYCKPGDLKRRPFRNAPYQPRIDWQAWFLPFGYFRNQWWFQSFLIRLLQGSPKVLKLLKYNPFPDKPPLYVRALMYDYNYTTPEEKKTSGCWWKRELVGTFAYPMQLTSKKEVG